ncbi:hypothetical protein C8J57DRAFT_1726230 [Mycena rebaudengoi]|nr:hypothetical protein C8J57DRAFT_1726230 [Mycena rebaudengoi]
MSSPVCIPEYPPLGPTYGAWLVSLFLETILYGMGALQCFLYFQWWSDGWRIKIPVIASMAFETIQIVFFFHSTYARFVERFGFIQTDLLWSDSVQLLANYLSAFTVQIYFASRIYQLTSERIGYNSSRSGIYVVLGLAFTGVAAGITQTILTYELRSFLKLEETKAITTLQTVASLACDVVITVYLCVCLHRNKTGIPKTNAMLNTVIINAVNRGMLTSISAAATMILFLVTPNTFWFFLGLAPEQQMWDSRVLSLPMAQLNHIISVYLNSMLATLNTRRHVRGKSRLSIDKGWDSIPIDTIPSSDFNHRSVSPVNFTMASAHIPEKNPNFTQSESSD